MDQIIMNFLSKLELGELKIFKNMAVIPLFSSMDGSPQYLSLGEAMGKGLLTITEVNQSGAVPELKVVNKADIPVLLLDGEELAGAKQNRVLNTTILLMEKSETIIPVSCVEHGRWAYTSNEFAESGNIMSNILRMKCNSSVALSLRDIQQFSGDQRKIWDGIDHLCAEANVSAPTEAMRDVFESREDDLGGYLDAFQYVPDQKGIFVLVNGIAVGFDILSLSSVYEKIHPKLIKSYAMDASLSPADKTAAAPVEKTRRFLKSIQCAETKYKPVGEGWNYRFEGHGSVGSALVVGETVIHMAFFKMSKSEKVGRMSSASRRRRYRV